MAAALVDGASATPTWPGATPHGTARWSTTLQSAYAPDELGFQISAVEASALADRLLACVGTRVSRLSTLNEGNVLDGLGRPENPGPDRPDVLRDRQPRRTCCEFLELQFTEGPAV